MCTPQEGNPVLLTDPTGHDPCNLGGLHWCAAGNALVSGTVAKGLEAMGAAISSYANIRAAEFFDAATETINRARATQRQLERQIGTGLKQAWNLLTGKARELRLQGKAVVNAATKEAKALTESGQFLKVGAKVVGRTLILVGGIADGMDDYQNDTRYSHEGQRKTRAILAGTASAFGALIGDVAELACLEGAIACSPAFAYMGSELFKDAAIDWYDRNTPPIGPEGTELLPTQSAIA